MVGGIALSPDGRTAAFIASVGSKTQLGSERLDAAGSRPIPGSDGAAYPFWSPDSKSIGFFDGRKLRRVDLAGGNPTEIRDATITSLRGGAWTNDGRILFGTLQLGLFTVSASGGAPAPLTTLSPSAGVGYQVGRRRFLAATFCTRCAAATPALLPHHSPTPTRPLGCWTQRPTQCTRAA